jgi:hypothetical protein
LEDPRPPVTPAPTVLSVGAIPTTAPESRPVSAPRLAPSHAPAVRVTGVGDSVMLGAASELKQAIGDIDIDAAVGRQVSTAINILRARRAAGQLGEVVVVHIGNNGPFSIRQFDEMMQLLTDVHRVVFVNMKVPRRWEGQNNELLADQVQLYPNTVLVDWHAVSVHRPELFWNDGVHLRPEGARVYADLIAAYVKTP